MDRYSHIDENALDRIDRLGLAHCRLNGWEWDEIVGPKPEGFDEMPLSIPGKKWAPGTRSYYIGPARTGIENIIGEANTSRCHWIFNLRRTEEEWLRWYCSTEKAFYDGRYGGDSGDSRTDPESSRSPFRRLLRLFKLL